MPEFSCSASSLLLLILEQIVIGTEKIPSCGYNQLDGFSIVGGCRRRRHRLPEW